jgi:hypothetical protein
MNTTALDSFVKKVMNIDTDYPGMGGASSAIVGGTSTNEDIANDLRKNVIAFAREYSSSSSDKAELMRLSEQLQGSLFALNLVNVISAEKLDELFAELEILLTN